MSTLAAEQAMVKIQYGACKKSLLTQQSKKEIKILSGCFSFFLNGSKETVKISLQWKK